MQKYRAIGDRVIARRRPVENGSDIIITAETDYVKNKWCDVLAVGTGMWCSEMENPDGTKGGFADLGLDVGDVAYIIQYHGTKIDKYNERELISIHCHQIEEAGDTVWAIEKAKRYRRIKDGKVFRGVKLPQRMDVKVYMPLLDSETKGDLYKEVTALKGDFLLSDPHGNQLVCNPEWMKGYEEIPDEGRFGVYCHD